MFRILLTLVLTAISDFGCADNKYQNIPTGYSEIAIRNGIPPKVFFSMALQESGTLIQGRLVPWPWTLNIRGKGYRYRSEAAACTALKHAVRAHLSVDIGLLQIHWQSHKGRFREGFSPCVLLRPPINLKLAAQIFKEQLSRAEGDVWKAVGWYHHPSKESYAARYRQFVMKHYQRRFV